MTLRPALLTSLLVGTLSLTACSPSPQAHRDRADASGSPVPGASGATPPAPALRATRASASYAGWRLPFPVARSAVTSVAGDPRRTLLAGGMLPGDASTARVTELDPTTGRRAPAPSLGIAVHDAAAGSLAGRPAVYGGGNATEQSAVQVLRAGRWTTGTPLPTTRSDLSVAAVGGRSLVVGGYDGTHVPRSVLASRGGRWVQLGALREGVRYAATATVGREVFVFGGEVDHRELASVQRIDADTGRTTLVARLPVPLGHAMAAQVGGRVLLMGGRTGPDAQTDAMWWFDPGSGVFSRAGRLPGPLSDASTVSRGRRVWLLGGESPQVTDTVVEVTVS